MSEKYVQYYYGAGVAQWFDSQQSAKKICVIVGDHQFPVLSSDCVFRFPTRSQSTMSEDRTMHMPPLGEGGIIMHIDISDIYRSHNLSTTHL